MRKSVESERMNEAMRQGQKRKEGRRHWCHVAVTATLSMLAKAAVVGSGRGGKGGKGRAKKDRLEVEFGLTGISSGVKQVGRRMGSS